MSSPSIRTVPDVGRRSAPIIVSRVVFPDPDGPMMSVISPASVSKVTPSTARTSVRPLPKTFVSSAHLEMSAWALMPGTPSAGSMRLMRWTGT